MQVVHHVPDPEPLEKRYAPVWDEAKKCYVLPDAMSRRGIMCDFCGKEQYAPNALLSRNMAIASKSSLSSPSQEEMAKMQEVGLNLISCLALHTPTEGHVEYLYQMKKKPR